MTKRGVIASQCAHWRGNPRNRAESTIGSLSKIEGIATSGCALLAMTAFFDTLGAVAFCNSSKLIVKDEK